MEIFGEFSFEATKNIYKFNVIRVINWKVDNKVLRIVGDHFEDKSNEDVDEVSFKDINIKRFPRRIDSFFPNLKALTINCCGLKSIKKSDLKGLSRLKQLTFNGNKISSLPDYLFESTPAIETISFYGNRIQFIGLNTLDMLRNLTYANFKMNVNIDVCYKTEGKGVTLQELQKIVSVDCQPKFDGDISNFFKDLAAVYAY